MSVEGGGGKGGSTYKMNRDKQEKKESQKFEVLSEHELFNWPQSLFAKIYDMLIFSRTHSLISLLSKFWYQLLPMAFFKSYFEYFSSSHVSLIQNESYQQSPEKNE